MNVQTIPQTQPNSAQILIYACHFHVTIRKQLVEQIDAVHRSRYDGERPRLGIVIISVYMCHIACQKHVSDSKAPQNDELGVPAQASRSSRIFPIRRLPLGASFC